MGVVPTTYLGPLSWFAQLPAAIEVNETFEKQTFRNRCLIHSLSTNEMIRLTVPVCKVESKQLTRDIKISYQQHWQHQHWMAIRSAYEHTPYFLYYEDYIRPFYEKEIKFLIDLNTGLTETIWHILHNEQPPTDCLLHPHFEECIYTSTWSGEIWTDRHPWQNETSILETLFEKGPETLRYAN